MMLFKNESKRTSIHYGPAKNSLLANIHKFALNNANENEIR